MPSLTRVARLPLIATVSELVEIQSSSKRHRFRYWAAVGCLILALAIELLVPAWQQSPTFDEGCHLLAGYTYWRWADFGVNPEHPPALKLLAALSLLRHALSYPPADPAPFSKVGCFLAGRDFLYSNSLSADALVLRARAAVSIVSILSAVLTFLAAYEMFGATAGLLALVLFVFEPNLIAHGSLVTTDTSITLFLLATVYAFYRFVQRPTLQRLLLTGIVAGLAFAAKHSAILLVPILLLLSLGEIFRGEPASPFALGGRLKHALHLAGSLLVIAVLSLAILWSLYGFRFGARPEGEITPASFHQYLLQIQKSGPDQAILFFARHHLLPEAYLYGLADVMITSQHVMPYLFGKVYSGGQWFYFPAVFLIKSTLGFLLLLVLVVLAIFRSGNLVRRELLFLAVPVAVYFAAAMTSGFNVGVRHILPVYPFLIILDAFAACAVARRSKSGLYLVSALLLLHVASSLRAFPNYLPYSNEIFGGSSRTYKVLTDSNVDWGQQLRKTKTYLDRHGIQDCWFDYLGRSIADPAYYGISCKPLPEALALRPSAAVVPEHISGTVLISATELSPELWGPGRSNPYFRFQALRPDDVIAGGILVFRGEFDVPEAAAVSRSRAAAPSR